jgi:hypothetical protein
VILAVAGYGVFRAGAVLWGMLRDGLPHSLLGWTAFAGDAAATGQAFAVVALLVLPQLCRPLAAWLIGGAGVGAAVLDAGVWTVIGGDGGGPGRHVRQMVIAVGFAGFAAVLSRWGVGWAVLDGGGGYDWARVNRVMLRVAGGGLVVAAVGGGLAVLVDQPGPLDRLVSLVAGLGVGAAVGAVMVLLPVIGEQRREVREATMAEIYRRMDETRRRDDE